MNNHTTPKQPTHNNFYQRAGQQPSFLTNATSVNIATAFARAHITSDTIDQRPGQLKGTPMSPSQLNRMDVDAFIPDHMDTRTHIDSNFNSNRPRSIRPVREITSQRLGQYNSNDYNYRADALNNEHVGGGTGALARDILRDRPWADQKLMSMPGWLKRAAGRNDSRDIADTSPPDGLIDTPSAMISGAANTSLDYNRSLIDIGVEQHNIGNDLGRPRLPGGMRSLADELTGINRGEILQSGYDVEMQDAESQYVGYGRRGPLARTNIENGSRLRSGVNGTNAFGDRGDAFRNDKDGAFIDGPRLNGRYSRDTASNAATNDFNLNYIDSTNPVHDEYRNPTTSRWYTGNGNGAGSHNINNNTTSTADGGVTAEEPARWRATGRMPYSLRERVSTPGRLSYDRNFNIREEGHEELLRTAQKPGAKGAPTPYTVRIKGPGAFPATAQRFSQQRTRRGARSSAGDDNGSPTIANVNRVGGTRRGTSDFLTDHPYLSHGQEKRRGWGEYMHHGQDSRGVESSIDDSFASYDSGGYNVDGDNPTLLKRLFQNIASRWNGTPGTFSERLSFTLFMVFFVIKETLLVTGSFLARLIFNGLFGPLYTAAQAVMMLPVSVWRLAVPGSSHNIVSTVTALVTGIAVVAVSVFVIQFGWASIIGPLTSIGSLLPGIPFIRRSGNPPITFKPPSALDGLKNEGLPKLGENGAAVVEHLLNVENALTHLYGILETLRIDQEEGQQGVHDTLKRLEDDYTKLKHEMDSQAAKDASGKGGWNAGTSSGGFALEMKNLRSHVEKLAKDLNKAQRDAVANSSVQDKNLKSYIANLRNNRDIRRLITDAIHAHEHELKETLIPDWLEDDSDSAYANVARMIDVALSKYANDRVGKTDFALFSAGARVIPRLTSPTFEPKPRALVQRLWRAMGMTASQPPTVALDPNTHIGQCWPMNGSVGQIAIRLSQTVDVSEFAIEHIAKSVAIDWRSAPRDIEVWGYVSNRGGADAELHTKQTDAYIEQQTAIDGEYADFEGENVSEGGANDGRAEDNTKKVTGINNPIYAEGENTGAELLKLTLLARYRYTPSDTQVLQTFKPTGGIDADGTVRLRTLILKVNSNWGHPDHTCLYRFRVHGHKSAHV